MTSELDNICESLEEIASNSKEIKDALLPVEKRIREKSIELPMINVLKALYEELLVIQRIAMLKSSGSNLLELQSRAILPFATALHMPIRPNDFPFDYMDFYRTGSLGISRYSSLDEKEKGSLDLLIELWHNPNLIVLEDLLRQSPIKSRDAKLQRINERDILSGLVLSDEVSKRKLKDLQYFYTLETDQFFGDYIRLLKSIKEKLGVFAESNLERLTERKIPTSLPKHPITIFADDLSAVYKEEEKEIIRKMINSGNWSDSFEAIKDLICEVRNPRLGNLKRYRVLLTDRGLTPADLSQAPVREDIIGVDENLKRLESLVRGYAKGKSTPNIVLLGQGGVGKTLSLRYVIEATRDIKDVRYFLMNSLANIRELAELSDSYKPIGIIDDLRGEVNPRVYANLKQELEGLEDRLLDKTLVIISANPEIWDSLDNPVKQRLGGVELTYKPNNNLYEQLIRHFCKRFNVSYRQEIAEQVKEMVPRQVRDYVRALGSEQAGLESKD